MTQGVLFDRESATKIADTVRRSWSRSHVPRPIGTPAHAYRPSICGVLAEDLDPATDPLTGATWALADVYAIDPFAPPTDSAPRALKATGRQEHVINRDLDASATTGTFFVAEWVNAEWLVVWLGCGPPDTSASDSGGGGGTTAGGGGTLGGGGLGGGGLGGP